MKEQSSFRERAKFSGEFCVVDGEFSDLRCLMNTLCMYRYSVVLGMFSNNTGCICTRIKTLKVV